MLAIEVELLTGVSVAAHPDNRDEPEWPPHPDRLFQALVAAWGRNEPPLDDERAALEWLERLDSEGLVVSAPWAHRRDVVPVYVPPNDARTTKDVKKSIPVVPELRLNRNARRFAAVVPAAQPPVVRYIWKQADGFHQHRAALSRLAAEVTYLGHSHTLVRVAVLDDRPESEDLTWMAGGPRSLRIPHRGRLAHLMERYRADARPHPSLVQRRLVPPRGEGPPSTLFDPIAIVLRDDGGFVPALDAFPLVAKRLRDAFLQTADGEGLPIPTLLSGHDADGAPAETPHIAILPLADVGWRYSHGRLMGIALLLPRETDDGERAAALRALVAFHRRGAELHFGRLGSWQLAFTAAPDLKSLRFARYVGPSCRWATVLPAVLDRHPKDKPGRDLAAIVEQACLSVGLPRDAVGGLRVEAHAFSAITAAPPASRVRQALPEDSPYRGRPLRHLVLTFAQPVGGPLVLGAGRYRGLGLCLPIGKEESP